MKLPQGLIDTVAEAISRAERSQPYALFNYSSYPGSEPPHVIRIDNQEVIARYADRHEARQAYEKLCRDHVAQSALVAAVEWLEKMGIGL